MSETARRTSFEFRMHTTGLIAGIVVFVAILALPALGELTQMQQTMAAVGALMTIWWITEALPIPVTSMVPLVLFPVLEITSVQQAATPYANHLIYLFLGGFVLALGIERSGLHRRIALHVIRMIGTSPSRIVLGFMCATAFLSMWISNTATALLMLPIAVAVTKQVAALIPEESGGGDALQSVFGTPLMLGIAYAASIGGIATLIGTPPNIVFAGVLDSSYGHALEVGFLQWMLFGVPFALLFLPFVWWYLTRIISSVSLTRLKAGPGARNVIRTHLADMGKLSRAEWRMAVVFTLTAFAWIFRSPIDIGALHIPGLTGLFPGISDSTIGMFSAVMLFIVPSGEGRHEKLMDWNTVKHGVPWGILLLFGGGFALAEGFETTGLTLLLGQSIAMLQGLPVLVVIALVCFLLTFLTELTSNTATAAVLIPVVASAAIAMHQHPLLLMVPATVSASCAFMLPVATPPNAIVYSSGWMNIRQMARAGFALNLVGVALVALLMYTLGLAVFDITPGTVPAGIVQP